MTIKSVIISYKFMVPDDMPKTAYTYQKLFRALYGYTQDVYKSMGKEYKYYRPGVLSKYPFLKPNKNKVIIPMEAVQEVRNFFQTGINPAHAWREKGNWKIIYQMEEKNLKPVEIIPSLETLLERTSLGDKTSLSKAIENPSKEQKQEIRMLAEKIINNSWFRDSYKFSTKLSTFYKNYKKEFSS